MLPFTFRKWLPTSSEYAILPTEQQLQYAAIYRRSQVAIILILSGNFAAHTHVYTSPAHNLLLVEGVVDKEKGAAYGYYTPSQNETG